MTGITACFTHPGNYLSALGLAVWFLLGHTGLAAAAENASPPATPVKLVFIHHSCGENWLSDANGGLGRALGRNNYFVSDSNYGWGPHGIGDRTDITDWPTWFTGPESATYTRALYRLSDTNSPFKRLGGDPGGENSIIMFKSCFPNSELEGRPDDPPRRGEGLSVSNAKAIYNELLGYFATRPDKLFIAVTAPPVLERRLGRNARAFNNWLVHDWLQDYAGRNVAVFDFYNILTGPNNHHRFHNGKVQHLVAGKSNTLHYSPGNDAHPTRAGNRKATAEFVPLLNVYYHRWQNWLASVPAAAVPDPSALPATAPAEEQPPPPPQPVCEHCEPQVAVEPGGLIDGFDDAPKGWQVFSDEGQPNTKLGCGAETGKVVEGKAALAVRYDIAAQSWATCSLVLPAVENWANVRGISFQIQMEHPAQEMNVVAYGGEFTDRLAHYEHPLTAGPANIGHWQRVELTWDQFVQPPWEGDGTAKFDPARAKGLAFAFGAPPDGSHTGTVWVDTIRFLEE